MFGAGVQRILADIAYGTGAAASATTASGGQRYGSGPECGGTEQNDAGVYAADFGDNFAALQIGIVMAGDADGGAKLQQKLICGVVFVLLGDANGGVSGGVILDVDVAFELFKAGDVSVFCP